MQDYVIVRGYINPSEKCQRTRVHHAGRVEPVGLDSTYNDLDAPFRIGVLHVATMRERTSVLANAPQYLRNEGNCNKDLSDLTPL